MKIKEYPIDQLISAEYNPRQLTQRQYQNLRDSIQRFGLVDPILINVNKDRKNIIIGGHQRLKIAKVLGIENIPCVELDLTLEKEKELNIRLNQNIGDWDFDLLANNFDFNELLNWGFNEIDLQIFDNEKEEVYSSKIKSPVYEIKNSKPQIEDVIDDTKTKELFKEIEESSVTQEEKEFLKNSAMRHYVFDYSKIADYYAHSDNEMQGLMEKSALVIIDYEKAIENGFVEMTQYMRDIQLDDE